MKTISYTKMRDELADVLDMLRNGESITVTQRGRPDIVLAARAAPVAKGEWYTVGEVVERNRHGMVERITTIGRETVSLEMVQSKNKISFDEARAKTAKKHAKIIKALEDK
ncbi:type II toxin-antitoxin system Phd/YefM family antitoxin [Rahnella aceris]|uniref:type II toxin-antitoxin system Phd/YefM family antitoxin n=1 Tax=Rahnella sp. (strain Y9602) TaxID=2703885 RepID=UPI001C26D04A|nr:type II toxin-antitoxin system prevent-host-death family antitoxin [Rahnella aceris]MBU9866799.1 type II toxin-antitoxin system prevent-host-death family antitoxin [Rahnella aceris]